MKVLLLAAGRSRRAKPIEDKNFLHFVGKTLIEHQLDALKAAGFEDILIVGGAHNLDRLSQFGKTIEQEDLDAGMAGAILAAEKHVQDEALVIVSSNDVVDSSAYQALKSAMEGEADAYLLAVQQEDYFPGGYLELDGKRITNIVEKPGAGNEPSNLVNIVLHAHMQPQALFESLKNHSSDKDDHYEVAMAELMKTQNFEAVAYDGFWQPVKFPWHVLKLMRHFLPEEQSISPDAQVAETATINGPVHIEAGARIFDNAVIQGPAYIGRDAIVANNALVRESSIAARSVVGYSTEVARSYVGEDSWFHSNYIGDSVIGDDCSFGAGAVCANLRLDEAEIADSGLTKLGAILGDHIRIGVNTNLMPGVKIGSGSFIGSGLTLAEDIAAKKFVYGKTELVIKDNRSTLDPSDRSAMMQSLKQSS